MAFLILSGILLSLSMPISIVGDHIAIAVGAIGLLSMLSALKPKDLDWRVVAVSFVGLFSSFFSGRFLFSLRNSHYLWHFLPYFIISRMKRTKLPVLFVMLGLSASVGAIAVIFEAFTGVKPQDILSIKTLQVMHHPLIASGFFSTHLTTGCIAAMLFLVYFGVALFCKERPWKIYASVVAFLLFLGLVLSFSRSYWVGAFVAILLLPLIHRSKKSVTTLLFMLGVFGVLYIAMPSIRHRVWITIHYRQDVSSMDRIVLWKAGLDLFKHYNWKQKLIGCGSGNVYEHLKPFLVKRVEQTFGHKNVSSHLFSALHNEYLQILVKWGIIGLVVWIYLWAYVFYRNAVFIKRASSRWHKALMVGLTLAFVAFLVGGIFEHNVGDAEVIVLVMFLLGADKNLLDSMERGVA